MSTSTLRLWVLRLRRRYHFNFLPGNHVSESERHCKKEQWGSLIDRAYGDLRKRRMFSTRHFYPVRAGLPRILILLAEKGGPPRIHSSYSCQNSRSLKELWEAVLTIRPWWKCLGELVAGLNQNQAAKRSRCVLTEEETRQYASPGLLTAGKCWIMQTSFALWSHYDLCTNGKNVLHTVHALCSRA